MGWAYNEPTELPTPSHSPAVGLRGGVDMDLHFNIWFIGWSFSYEALKQTRGNVVDKYAWWHFFGWNLIPVFRLGVDLGKRAPSSDEGGAQTLRARRRPRGALL